MNNWENNIRRVVPYVPGEQPKFSNIIKLNTNENPYPPSPKVKEALERLDCADFRLYPDPACEDLVSAIAAYYELSPEQIFVGVGSDDVLAMVFMTCFNSEKPILFPDITYSFYDVWADMLRIPYTQVPLTDEFTICKEDYYRENGGIVFPNPNAPTGVELAQEDIEDIVRHNPDSVVIVDEAYVDFGAVSALPLIDKYDNVLIVQTFSKSRSLAGMRIGFAMGSPKLISFINDVKYSFNSYTMDRTALVAGKASIEDREYFKDTVRKVVEVREWTKKELHRLGFVFADSRANFIFVGHPVYPAAELFTALREEHIIVRYFNKPRISNFLRITIGTREEMQKLIDFLEKYCLER